MGANGILVSNHGARQLDVAPSPIDMLSAIRNAVGNRVELMIDSGVRRGSDIIIAMCLGAKFAFFGRPTLYAVTAGGLAGAEKALAIVRNEVRMVMAQIGCQRIQQLHPGWLQASGDSAI
jgi:L-lactate dehydrogenase (cytochrome)/(S)-mandelate dehydrogenase